THAMHSGVKPFFQVFFCGAYPTGRHDAGPWKRSFDSFYKLRTTHLFPREDLYNLGPKFFSIGDLGERAASERPGYFSSVAYLRNFRIQYWRYYKIGTQLQV